MKKEKGRDVKGDICAEHAQLPITSSISGFSTDERNRVTQGLVTPVKATQVPR